LWYPIEDDEMRVHVLLVSLALLLLSVQCTDAKKGLKDLDPRIKGLYMKSLLASMLGEGKSKLSKKELPSNCVSASATNKPVETISLQEGDSGNIMSPDYSIVNYPDKISCAWEFVPPANKKVKLSWVGTNDIEEPMTPCTSSPNFNCEELCFDYVFISDEDGNNEGIHCGSFTRAPNDVSGTVKVTFITDSSLNRQGFKLQYTLEDDN
jgi:hypothetical protein